MLKKCSKLTINLNLYLLVTNNLKIVSLQAIEIKILTTLKKEKNMSKNTGKVSQIIGPVVDVTFDNETKGLPDIYDSLEITRENGDKLILECQQHIGEDTVRAISMESTDGVSRGTEVVATGAPIKMPAGEDIKGRVFNVIGDAIDGM